MNSENLDQFRAAEAVVRRFFPPTPLIYAPRLSERLGTEVWLKLDIFTPIRTFKIRGALNKLNALVNAGVTGGVVTASAGNHGLAVARAARLFGRPAVVVVPEAANPQKVALIAAEGARVVHHGQDYQAAFERCLAIGEAEGLTLVHAYDDPDVIAGQSTIGLELVDSGVDFDTVIMGIGGGGLISGVAAAVKRLKPGVRVIGVQPEGANSMIRSVNAGRIVELDQVQTIADGLGARKPGEHTLAMTQRYVDELRPVGDEDLWIAMRTLLREERIVVEPAGAAGTAALLRDGARGLGRVVILASGANIADAVLEKVMG
ncbi:MAG: threonine ammonia-lyase [Bacillota bacterium]